MKSVESFVVKVVTIIGLGIIAVQIKHQIG
jgi:hypothetical protein